MSRLEIYFLHDEGECICVSAAVLQRGGPEGGADWGRAASSPDLMELPLLLLLEALQRSDRGL